MRAHVHRLHSTPRGALFLRAREIAAPTCPQVGHSSLGPHTRVSQCRRQVICYFPPSLSPPLQFSPVPADRRPCLRSSLARRECGGGIPPVSQFFLASMKYVNSIPLEFALCLERQQQCIQTIHYTYSICNSIIVVHMLT